MLQHPLLVADDDFRRVQIDQLLQPVVAVDDAAIQIVQIARGEVAASRATPSGRRSGGMTGITSSTIHSGRLLAIANRLDDLEPVDQSPSASACSSVSLRHLRAGPATELTRSSRSSAACGRLRRPCPASNCLAVLFASRGGILLRSTTAAALSGVSPGFGDDVVLEVDHLLEAGRLHVEQSAQPAGHGLEEPDVNDGRGQFDVPHALAANAAVRDFDAAAIADHPLVLHAAVLAAGALPVLFRAEDTLAEQAVLFRTVRAVVDRFRLLHFAERPAADIVRARQADLARTRSHSPDRRAFADTHAIAP